jgi:hypothetical protein
MGKCGWTGGVMFGDPMTRFLIEPTSDQAWRWRTLDEQGRPMASGLAATRKIAAAMVIRHILDRMERPRPQTAEAA